MSLMPLLVLGPAVFFLWEGRSKETKGVKNQASKGCFDYYVAYSLLLYA